MILDDNVERRMLAQIEVLRGTVERAQRTLETALMDLARYRTEREFEWAALVARKARK